MTSACDAILEELDKILRLNPPDVVTAEVWRIKTLVNTDCSSESLNKVHDEALDLKKIEVQDEIEKKLGLIMSIARYEFDVRSPSEK